MPKSGLSISSIDKYVYRSKYVGVVFQSYNLLTKYTALENVVLSMDIARYKTENKNKRALELLDSVGLDEDEANRRILKLSGGQQQRVAIARALAYDPDIILADEPTGNLDADTQNEIMAIFRELVNQGKCVILVSHSPEVVGAVRRKIRACENFRQIQTENEYSFLIFPIGFAIIENRRTQAASAGLSCKTSRIVLYSKKNRAAQAVGSSWGRSQG